MRVHTSAVSLSNDCAFSCILLFAYCLRYWYLLRQFDMYVIWQWHAMSHYTECVSVFCFSVFCTIVTHKLPLLNKSCVASVSYRYARQSINPFNVSKQMIKNGKKYVIIWPMLAVKSDQCADEGKCSEMSRNVIESSSICKWGWNDWQRCEWELVKLNSLLCKMGCLHMLAISNEVCIENQAFAETRLKPSKLFLNIYAFSLAIHLKWRKKIRADIKTLCEST